MYECKSVQVLQSMTHAWSNSPSIGLARSIGFVKSEARSYAEQRKESQEELRMTVEILKEDAAKQEKESPIARGGRNRVSDSYGARHCFSHLLAPTKST